MYMCVTKCTYMHPTCVCVFVAAEVCPKGKYRCGTATEQCVSDILVCDGHKDCADGSDEDEHVCSTYTHAHLPAS